MNRDNIFATQIEPTGFITSGRFFGLGPFNFGSNSGQLVSRITVPDHIKQDVYSSVVDITGRFDTGALKHTLLPGAASAINGSIDAPSSQIRKAAVRSRQAPLASLRSHQPACSTLSQSATARSVMQLHRASASSGARARRERLAPPELHHCKGHDRSLIPTDPLYGQRRAGTAPVPVCASSVMDRHFKPVEPVALRLTVGGPLPFRRLRALGIDLRHAAPRRAPPRGRRPRPGRRRQNRCTRSRPTPRRRPARRRAAERVVVSTATSTPTAIACVKRWPFRTGRRGTAVATPHIAASMDGKASRAFASMRPKFTVFRQTITMT